MDVDPNFLAESLSDPRALAGLGVGGAILYKIWRILKVDRRNDRQEESQDKFYISLQAQLASAISRADAFAVERNTAIAGLAKSDAERTALENRLSDLKAENAELSRQVKAAADQMIKLNSEYALVKATVEVLQMQLAQALRKA